MGKKASYGLRSVASFVVLALFPFFVLLVLFGILAAAVWVGERTTTSVGQHVGYLAIPLVIAVGAAVKDVMKARRPEKVPGVDLTREEHPALWSELDWIAGRMGQPHPDRVVVLPMVNAFVTESTGRREVAIGHPLLAGLTRLQLRAVLAHEMGHLAHGHTRAAYRAGAVLEQTVTRLDRSIVRRLMVGYHHVYLLISMSMQRDHERQADVWSARLAGGPAAASVFPEMARIAVAWKVLDSNYVPLAMRSGRLPGLAYGMQQIGDGLKDAIDEHVHEQLRQPASRWSTHPGDGERMRFLDEEPDRPDLPNDHDEAWQLLGHQPPAEPGRAWEPDWDAAAAGLQAVEAQFLGTESRPASWEAVVEDHGLADPREDVRPVLRRMAEILPGVPPTLRGLLGALGDGHEALERLLGPRLRNDLAADKRLEGLYTVCLVTAAEAVQLAAGEQGRYRLALRWDGPAEEQYADPSGTAHEWPTESFTPEDPEDRAAVAALLERLAAAGIDPDVPFAPDEDDGTPDGAHSMAVGGIGGARVNASMIVLRQKLHDVLLLDDGLVLQKLRFGVTRKIALQSQYMQGALIRGHHQRLQELAHAVAGEPEAWAQDADHRSRWVPWSSVRRAWMKDGVDGLTLRKLDLELMDGERLLVTWGGDDPELGSVGDSLRGALDGRLGEWRRRGT